MCPPYSTRFRDFASARFCFLPLIEHFRRDERNSLSRVGSPEGEMCICRVEKSSAAAGDARSLLLTPVKFGRRPSGTSRRSETLFVAQPGLVIRITLIISVFSIAKNNESLLPGEHLIMYVQRKSLAQTFASFLPGEK